MLIPHFSNAQVVVGQIDHYSGTPTIYLLDMIGNQSEMVDSCVLSETGSFQFSKTRPLGYYMLSVADTNFIQFISNPKEDTVKFRFGKPELRQEVVIEKSKENTILWRYKYASRGYMDQIKAVQIARSYLPENDTLGAYRLSQMEDSIMNVKHLDLMETVRGNENTYFSKVVLAAELPQYSTDKEIRAHYFDNIDFSDESLIRCFVLPNRIMTYFQQYTEFSTDGFQNSVDEVLGRAGVNNAVYEFCLNYLLELFDRVGPPLIFQYIVEQYLVGEGCSDVNVTELMSGKATAYRNLLPGKTLPEVVIPNVKGDSMSLYSLIAEKELSLLFFWASHCSYCKEALPVVKALELEYPERLNVVAISLDNEKGEWLEAINEYKIQHWKHLSNLDGWQSASAKLYKVHKTPYYYLVDNKGVILSKPVNKDALFLKINQRLSKG